MRYPISGLETTDGNAICSVSESRNLVSDGIPRPDANAVDYSVSELDVPDGNAMPFVGAR